MFPDVFESSVVGKQNLQMCSFYEARDKIRTQARLQLKPNQSIPNNQHGLGHVLGLHQVGGNPNSVPLDVCEAVNNDNMPQNSTKSGSISPHAKRPPVLPSMRRMVKFVVTPLSTMMPVAICLFLNTIIWSNFTDSATPSIVTHSRGFLYLWPLTTLVQLVSYSVYLCTPVTIWISVLHLVIITVTAAIPMHLLSIISFSRLLLFICITIAVYQSMIFCLVYSHLRYQWAYVIIASMLIVLPTVTQLIHLEHVEAGVAMHPSWVSVVSIYSIYAIATVNGRGVSIVEVSMAPSPTWLSE
jgi:hypothetical protein